MSTYFSKFRVQWADIDANRHMGNSAYMQYTAEARMRFMEQHRIGLKELNRWGVGPAILHERFSFFREIHYGQEFFVSVEIGGFSEDGAVYRFFQRFFLPDGTHIATGEATGVWIDLMLRKSTTPPDDILDVMRKYRSENCVVMSREDIKDLPFQPENVDAEILAGGLEN